MCSSDLGGNIVTAKIIIIEAIVPVIIKMAIVIAMILPVLAGESIFAIELEMDANISGTTMQSIRFINIFPSGAKIVAPLQNIPTMEPDRIPHSIKTGRMYDFFDIATTSSPCLKTTSLQLYLSF